MVRISAQQGNVYVRGNAAQGGAKKKTMKKSSVKREYLRLLRISNTQLKRELKKPDAEQDAALIDECLESIAFCRKALGGLRREKAGFSAVLRRAGAALLALVFCFAAFATVSEAAGFRVWTAIIKRDAGYLKVDYVPKPTNAPVSAFPGWDDMEYSFFSELDFDQRLVSDGFTPIVAEWGDYEFIEGSVRSTEKDYYATYTLQAEQACVRVRMIAKAGEPGPVSVWGMDESIPFTEAKVNGVPVSYQRESDGCVFATWQARGCIFSASLFDIAGPVEDVINEIVR